MYFCSSLVLVFDAPIFNAIFKISSLGTVNSVLPLLRDCIIFSFGYFLHPLFSFWNPIKSAIPKLPFLHSWPQYRPSNPKKSFRRPHIASNMHTDARRSVSTGFPLNTFPQIRHLYWGINISFPSIAAISPSWIFRLLSSCKTGMVSP